ncbi:MAG: hypothetical protein WAN75_15805 [Xanthobacteraceae bacterium]
MLSYWFPAAQRSKALGLFMSSTAISNVGAPLSTSLLALDGRLGLRGWQPLFILEGFRTRTAGGDADDRVPRQRVSQASTGGNRRVSADGRYERLPAHRERG